LNKKFVFLGGLPRTGSTAICAILHQNKDIHVEGQSALTFLMKSALDVCNTEAKDNLIRAKRENFLKEWMESIPSLYYKNVSKNIIVEKNRGWTRDDSGLKYFINKEPKTINLIRPVEEIVKSLIHFNIKNNETFPEKFLYDRKSFLWVSVNNVFWALEQNCSENFFITYDQFLENPQCVIKNMYSFWEIKEYSHSYENIKDPNFENDEKLNTVGLHKVRPSLEKRNYEVFVPQNILNHARQLDLELEKKIKKAKKINPENFI
jgi:sulfotransferase